MARVTVKESVCLGKKFFDGVMAFKDVQDMLGKVGFVDGRVSVSKGTYRLSCTHNMHYVSFTKDGESYDVHLTEKQFERLLPVFNEMGDVQTNEYFWWHHRF